MSTLFPIVLPVRLRVLARRDAWPIYVRHCLRGTQSHKDRGVAAFVFKNDERDFARALMTRKTALWVYRTNQFSFSGDFVVVDVASPWPDRRRAFVIDLKQGARLQIGGGGAGIQLQNAALAVEQVAALRTNAGARGADPPFELLTGDAGALLKFFAA